METGHIMNKWLYIAESYEDAIITASVVYTIWKEEKLKLNIVRKTLFSDLFIENEGVNVLGFPSKKSQIILIKCNENYSFQEKCKQVVSFIGKDDLKNIKLYCPPYKGYFDIECLNTKQMKVFLHIGDNHILFRIDPVLLQNYCERLKNELGNIEIVQCNSYSYPHILGTKFLVGGSANYSKLYEGISKCDMLVTTESFAGMMASELSKPAILLTSQEKFEIGKSCEVFTMNSPIDKLVEISMYLLK